MATNERGQRGRYLGFLGLALVGLAWWAWRADTLEAPMEETPRAERQRRARSPARKTVVPPPAMGPLGTQEARGQDSQMEEMPSPTIRVRCRAEAALLERLAEVAVHGRRVEFVVEGDELVLMDMPTEGTMTLFARGSAPIQAVWAETEPPGSGRCLSEPLALTPSGLVRGVVMNRAEWPQAWVVARVCGRMLRTDQDGRFVVLVEAGVCDVLAQRRDGLFMASSEVITLEIEAGSEHEVALWLPEYRQGGVGMGIVAHEEGVRIERVLDGGAAAEAGLQPGDVVLEVDGVPAAALTLEEFVQVTTGEAGTDVELIISRGEGSDREESIFLLDRRAMD
ncbi:MAG: hypothetical protein RIT28_763 [Pseudomonadota bacterium]